MKTLTNMLRVTTIAFLVAQASVVNAGPRDFRDGRDNDSKFHKGIKDKDKKNPSGAPIDGGASLLLAGGAAYVLRRISKARRKVA